MTKQNVVVADTIAVAVSNSSLFVPPAAKPPTVPGGLLAISRKALLQNLEISAGGRINAWVDSMKASSPTHIKSTPSLCSTDDQDSWIVSPCY